MQLPYLKNKLPRIAQPGPEDKLVNASSEDHLDDHCSGELMQACEERNPKKFRAALEALVMNLFDWDGEQDVTPTH